MFLVRLRALLQLVPVDLNERGSSGSYDLQICLDLQYVVAETTTTD